MTSSEIRILAFVIVCVSAQFAHADTVSLEYSGFYDRLKRVNKNSYPNAELVFSVPLDDNCKILSGSITTESQNYPLTYTKQQQIFLPFDAGLKSDRGLVNIEVAGDASQCAIAMQVRGKTILTHYSHNQLQRILDDMNGLLDALQGFPMKYFRKPLSGLTFEFSRDNQQDLTMKVDGVSQTISNKMTFTTEQVNYVKQIEFSQPPIMISPWVN
ncbi:DUF2987 domain-containing protein [Shewanella aestuarii]|uniref:DUF2987 domain-containing protein n=1 Tax=Shewanella aestuarii TaxID=1028752 RepID=A0A6G9QJB4_9GAMM|nr:DUF2987 domain-containing protein [Shewanella aestuarii]QIR14562.1 DUF2987 domain-containing protein [Shewanella aestuarii]